MRKIHLEMKVKLCKMISGYYNLPAGVMERSGDAVGMGMQREGKVREKKNQMQVTVYPALRGGGGGRNQCWRKLDLSTMRVLAG